jgi:hypothetical protein
MDLPVAGPGHATAALFAGGVLNIVDGHARLSGRRDQGGDGLEDALALERELPGGFEHDVLDIDDNQDRSGHGNSLD